MHDGRVDADDERTITESRRLRWLVDQALILEDLPDNPAVVELEKAVTVRDGQSVVAQYLIVHPIEAPWTTRGLSPLALAQALLGHQIGEEVEVAASTGPYRCRILAGERLPVAQDATPRTPTRRGEAVTSSVTGNDSLGVSELGSAPLPEAWPRAAGPSVASTAIPPNPWSGRDQQRSGRRRSPWRLVVMHPATNERPWRPHCRRLTAQRGSGSRLGCGWGAAVSVRQQERGD